MTDQRALQSAKARPENRSPSGECQWPCPRAKAPVRLLGLSSRPCRSGDRITPNFSTLLAASVHVGIWQILLQKSKVASFHQKFGLMQLLTFATVSGAK